jgi:murein DD-endopeptidase MepM/ murein hydrolase activator NlpD
MNRLISLCVILLLALLAFVLVRAHRRADLAPAPASTQAERPGLQAHPIHALRERDFGGANEYLVSNLIGGPIEVRCVLESPVNMRGDPPLPRRLVVPAHAERLVAELKPIDPSQPGRAAMSCEAMIGDPGAHPAEGYRYSLPFPAGTQYALDQGFGGRFSHHDDENRYALDFGVAEGTPVLAARAGVVMQVEDDFRGNGTDAARYGDRANYVRVLHDDGSMALYAHLAPESMLRRPGDQVVAGQLVGKSGNTGFSTGPHLHFSVQRNAGMALKSIPFEVTGVDPNSAPN